MTGGWQLLKKRPGKVMSGSRKDGFLTVERYTIAMTADITSEHKYKPFENKEKARLCRAFSA